MVAYRFCRKTWRTYQRLLQKRTKNRIFSQKLHSNLKVSMSSQAWRTSFLAFQHILFADNKLRAMLKSKLFSPIIVHSRSSLITMIKPPHLLSTFREAIKIVTSAIDFSIWSNKLMDEHRHRWLSYSDFRQFGEIAELSNETWRQESWAAWIAAFENVFGCHSSNLEWAWISSPSRLFKRKLEWKWMKSAVHGEP